MKKALIVIDMQNDFITGSLGTKEAVAIVPKVIEKIKRYEEKNELVIFTKDTHSANYLTTEEGRNLPVEHCIRGTWGWELDEVVESMRGPQTGTFEKGTFGSTALAKEIAKLVEVDEALEIELVGLCTDICVVSNALLIKAYCPEVKITVDASCCAGVTPVSHQAALATMKMCQINVVND